MNKYAVLIILIILSNLTLVSQNNLLRHNTIDVQKYEFYIAVNDSTDVIHVKAKITVLFKTTLSSFALDLVNQDLFNKGMLVDEIVENGNSVDYEHANNKILIHTNIQKSGELKTFTIKYHGIPIDGLVISKNKYGDRTFFGDNWPNRAQHWLSCVDHPLDKAFVEFYITAPSQYQVIANGTQIEETNLNNQNTLFVWKTDVPIPTKVMVIGIARFAVQHIGETHNIPISTWVYPQNKNDGFYDYAQAKDIINYFIEHVGPYPYTKLANVQSKTRFGGMENASNIFYSENSVTGERKHESLIVHEIAHQWFGNSATETDWKHIWLSEGFATYFTNLYILEKHGDSIFKELLKEQREKVIAFSKKQNTPVIDTVTTNLMRLLNANSYQKGGWVLHMLRKKLGDAIFWDGITQYYKKYALKNASTKDLQHVFEEVSNQQLDKFFEQWLVRSGHPILKTSWKQNKKSIKYTVQQTQKENSVFEFPLDLKIIYIDGTSEITTISVSKKEETFKLKTKLKVKEIIIDPDLNLLYEMYQGD